MKQIRAGYSASEISEMTATSIYMLMEANGADVFGLWSADKSDIMRSYAYQVGFRPEIAKENTKTED